MESMVSSGDKKKEALVYTICHNKIVSLAIKKVKKKIVQIIHCLKMGNVGDSQCAAASPEMSPARSPEWLYAASLLKVLTLVQKFH